jgi:polysaccharide export outer membrane protein
MQLSPAAIVACGVLFAGFAGQQSPAPPSTSNLTNNQEAAHRHARLAVGDVISIRVLDMDEIPDHPIRIDDSGAIDLPVAGRLVAAGQTTAQLEAEIRGRLRSFLKNPSVTVTVTEFGEEPVAVAGEVVSPGIKQVHGPKNLMEVLAEAGGLKPDAGPTVRITRLRAEGPLPLPDTHIDATGMYVVGEIRIRPILAGENPGENINILPHDLVTVPAAEMIYVLGEVVKPGAYELSTARMSVLDALALAGGSARNASSSRARVLRAVAGRSDRMEFQVNLDRILAGKAREFELQPQDIFYLPTNKAKVVSTRALEAMIGTGSSIAVFRGSR